MQVLKMNDLSTSSRLGLVWSFFWRGLVVTLGSAVCGALLGMLMGMVAGVVVAVLGIPTTDAKGLGSIAGGLSGCAVGFAFFYVYVAWLLRGPLGRYRLLLVRAGPSSD